MTTESGSYDQATILRKQKVAEAMLSDAIKPQEIRHWTQGLAQLGRAGVGGYLGGQANEEARALKSQDAAALASILGGGGGGAPASPTAPVASPMPAPQPPANVPVATAMSTPAVTPPVSDARAEVMPSGKVWGDKEAEAAGLYEPSGPKLGPGVKVAQAMAPQANLSPAAVPTPQPAASAPAAAPSGGLLAGATPQQIAIIKTGMAASEGSPARAVATAMMQNFTKSDGPTDETKEYKLAQSQGFKGTFFDFKTELKKAGATKVTTNVDQGENAFAKEAGKSQAQRFDELAQGGQQAKQMVSDIDTLNELGKNIGTGKGAEITAKIGPWAQGLGIDVKGLSDIQAFEAIVNRVAPTLRVKGSGAQSDLELKNFLKSLPSLGNTPEGNAMSTTTLKGLQENKIVAAEIASKALNREITPAQADKMLRELPDPMNNFREFMKNRKEGPAAPAKAAEGQTATNPKTGEKLILKGGQWVPMQ